MSFRSFFLRSLYVQVRRNKFQLRHIEYAKASVVSSTRGFSTKRLLVGNFSEASTVLQAAVKDLHRNRWFSPSPIILMHPLEMIEGGLSEIEERILKELGGSVGARKTLVWVGHELSDIEVRKRTREF